MTPNYFIDRIGNKLTFPDARFYKTEDGLWVPSVTTILDAYPKGPAYFEWLKAKGKDADEIRDEAGRRGSVVHQLTEDYDNGLEVSVLDDFGNIRCSMREWAMFERYVEFRQRIKLKMDFIELHVSDPKLGYAGTLDRIVTNDFGGGFDKQYVIDIKTSNAIYPHYWLQLAAYKRLWQEKGHHFMGVGILWLNAKTKTNGTKGAIQGEGWQLLLREDTAQDYKLFEATHALWLAENKNLQPKEFVYQLSHRLPMAKEENQITSDEKIKTI
jgi:hypothetical protein